MSEVTPESVREALSKVEDPATGRDIVSSRQLGAVEVGDQLRVEVALISPGYPLRGTLETRIREALEPFARPVEIAWGLAVPRKPARQDLDRLPTVKNVIAVAAGKGGVGKSTVSVNLAMALQRLGAKVGILDADIFGPSVPKMMGEPSRPCDRNVSGDRIIPALHRGVPVMSVDFFVETGRAVIWRGPMIHKLLQQFLEDVEWGELDYLIIDLPPGTGDAQLSLGQLLPITGSVVVTTPQEVALLDVRKAVDMFAKLEIPVLGVVENMSHYRCPACGHVDHIFASGGGKRLAEELEVSLLGQLPIDAKVSAGGETGNPVVHSAPDSEHAKAFLSLAATVALEAAKRHATGPKRSSLLRTV
ncbi:Mrp/NBP35 family ATP-binding protein [Pseudenhygromyxa sp. WMMC2535]|uniref:Mrp/NBP35 family ATP-binding protein n=1 Tax=Pseudenhygromyxa sp. WMMC2535 TaxID=2712867 RepID=UPI001551F22D|nr:Mrp/NBP35 family ATP-binding protein [Pseudenhygromyxa sp. WMMC2535]NVB38999.1 Mrp/NBP35 family ATP-binding protein [Pseudenhygromyxa sp. WMMC2535]